MSTDFADLTIIGLDTERTRPSSRASGLRHMYLTLSASPSRAWSQLFDQERQFPRHNMWRRAWIEGNAIVVDCVPEEIALYHLNDLKQDVAEANQKYRQYLGQSEAEQRRAVEVRAQEQKRLEDLKGRLDF